MKSEFWHQRWKEEQIGFHQSEINSYLQQHWSENFLDQSSVFVPLCGKSQDMLWLREQGHKVIGSELSIIAVRDFFEENELTPTIEKQAHYQRWSAEGITILVGDFFDLAPQDLQDVTTVYDRAALVALPESMREDYVTQLQQIVSPKSKILLITTTYPQQEMDGPPFSVAEREIRRLYQPHWQVEQLYTHNFPDDHPRLQNRGISRMEESVYLIR
ncbi:MAG TPA: thiopurine S-methyltransferase [Ectothiorhodospiraceae bacterium]|nr:thiopurine S-methyltransferase [Ectothiorhodospiraceae bacterium]